MFAIYKALTAVKLAEEATAAGVDAVPIFWLATYDHDLAEVNHISIPAPDGSLRTLTTSSHSIPGAPVSDVRLGDEILPVVDEAVSLLGESEATQILRETYRPGETLGTAFARFHSRLFAAYGVILLDASDPELHRIAAPIYRAAVEQAAEIDEALLARGRALEAAHYYQQVKVTTSSVLLFTLQDGARTPIQRHPERGRLRIRNCQQIRQREAVVGPTAGAHLCRARKFQSERAVTSGGSGLSFADLGLCRRRRRSRIFCAGGSGLRKDSGPRHSDCAAFFRHAGRT